MYRSSPLRIKPPSSLLKMEKPPSSPLEAPFKPPWMLQAPFTSPSSPLESPFKPPSSPPSALKASSPLHAPFKPPWNPLSALKASSPLHAPFKPRWNPSKPLWSPLKNPWSLPKVKPLSSPHWNLLEAFFKPCSRPVEAPFNAEGFKPPSTSLKPPLSPLQAFRRWSTFQAPLKSSWSPLEPSFKPPWSLPKVKPPWSPLQAPFKPPSEVKRPWSLPEGKAACKPSWRVPSKGLWRWSPLRHWRVPFLKVPGTSLRGWLFNLVHSLWALSSRPFWNFFFFPALRVEYETLVGQLLEIRVELKSTTLGFNISGTHLAASPFRCTCLPLFDLI